MTCHSQRTFSSHCLITYCAFSKHWLSFLLTQRVVIGRGPTCPKVVSIPSYHSHNMTRDQSCFRHVQLTFILEVIHKYIILPWAFALLQVTATCYSKCVSALLFPVSPHHSQSGRGSVLHQLADGSIL